MVRLFTGLALAFPLWYLLRRTLHMFQLNSYQALSYSHWLRDNGKEIFSVQRTVPLGLIAASSLVGWWGLPLAAFGSFLFWCANRPKRAKRPLAVTARVKRQMAAAALLTALWALLPGHFGLKLTAWTLLTPYWILLVGLVTAPVEQAVARWYYKDAARILSKNPGLRVIGITGSYGKTSTKFFLKELLSVKYDTYMTPGNYNTTLGVVRAVREGLRNTHEIFLCEMGARHLGDVREICQLVHPQMGVLTYIGQQHMETFGSQENIVKAKRELSDAVHAAGGTVFINLGSPILAAQRFGGHTVGTGIGCGDLRATDLSIGADGCSFTVSVGEESHRFRTRLLGRANVEDLILAMAVAHSLGVPLSAMEAPVRLLRPVPHRLELRPAGEITYIDDAYNSNPAGAAVALETLGLCRGLRVLVTPGLVELGAIEQAENEKVGRAAAQNCDWAILVDPRRGPDIRKGLLAAGFPEERIRMCGSLNEGLAAVRGLAPGQEKTVLLLNDLTDNY